MNTNSLPLRPRDSKAHALRRRLRDFPPATPCDLPAAHPATGAVLLVAGSGASDACAGPGVSVVACPSDARSQVCEAVPAARRVFSLTWGIDQ